MELFVLVTNDHKIDDFENPLIIDVINFQKFKSIKEYNKVKYIILGYENAFDLFGKEVDPFDMNINNTCYWFYDKKIEQWEHKFIDFIKLFFVKHKIEILLNLDEILENDNLKILHIIDNILLIKFIDKHLIYSLDLSIYSFFENSKINDFTSLFKHFKKHKIFLQKTIFFSDYQIASNVSNINIRLKENGLIGEKYSLENFSNIIKLVSENDLNKYTSNLIIVFEKLYKFYSRQYLEKCGLIEFSGVDVKDMSNELRNILDLTDYQNIYNNIVRIENYLNNVRINNLDFDKYPEVNFPIVKGNVTFKYGGLDSITGRIYPKDLNGYNALQTLPKELRDVLRAEEGCYLIEFDYMSFEFDILFQLLGLPLKEDFDPHVEIIKYLFGNSVDLKKYRDLGKQINYAIIYGMNIDKIVDNLLKDFEQKKDLLRYKLSEYQFYKNSIEFIDKIEINYFPEEKLLLNYFLRFIKIEKEHAVLNNYIQSTAADFLYIKMCMILDLLNKHKLDLDKNKILLQNFDSIILQLEDKVIEETDVFNLILEIMKMKINEIKGRIHYKYGKNWKYLE